LIREACSQGSNKRGQTKVRKKKRGFIIRAKKDPITSMGVLSGKGEKGRSGKLK